MNTIKIAQGETGGITISSSSSLDAFSLKIIIYDADNTIVLSASTNDTIKKLNSNTYMLELESAFTKSLYGVYYINIAIYNSDKSNVSIVDTSNVKLFVSSNIIHKEL